MMTTQTNNMPNTNQTDKKTIVVENVMKVIDISKQSVSKETIEYLLNTPTDYVDIRLKEHLHTVYDLEEKIEYGEAPEAPEAPENVWNEIKILIELCNEHDAAYVRFI